MKFEDFISLKKVKIVSKDISGETKNIIEILINKYLEEFK